MIQILGYVRGLSIARFKSAYTNRSYLHKCHAKAGEIWNLSHHLPIFGTVDNKLPTCDERKYFRDFSTFKGELFINDLNSLNFN